MLADRFETRQATVARPLTLCAPVKKGLTGIRLPKVHLKCYAIAGESKKPRPAELDVVVDNQFGKATLTVLQPQALCAPTFKRSIKKGAKPVSPTGRPERLLDHFTCYQARSKEPFQPRTVALSDQFEVERARVVQPVALCAPVEKNKVLIRDSVTHLTSYAIQVLSRKGKGLRTVVTRNQFGTEVITVLAPQTLCAPSRKQPPCSRYAEQTKAALMFQGRQIGTINVALHVPLQGVPGSRCP